MNKILPIVTDICDTHLGSGLIKTNTERIIAQGMAIGTTAIPVPNIRGSILLIARAINKNSTIHITTANSRRNIVLMVEKATGLRNRIFKYYSEGRGIFAYMKTGFIVLLLLVIATITSAQTYS